MDPSRDLRLPSPDGQDAAALGRLSKAVEGAIGEIPTRQWKWFGPLETTEARAWARSGNFAGQGSATGEEGWLMASNRNELVFACGCVGASPQPVRHPIDRLGCAELSKWGIKSVRGLSEAGQAGPVPKQPVWAAFPWNHREEGVAWAAGGNAAVLTQPGPVRWLLLPWQIAMSMRKTLKLKKPATQDNQIGWLKLVDDDLWREAFLLCSRDQRKEVAAVDPDARLGVVGIRGLEKLPVQPPARKVWDRLCMRIGRQLQIVRPARVLIAACPWTDAAALWAMKQAGWPYPVHLYLPVEWDLDGRCFALGDEEAFVARIKQSATYRPMPGSEDFLRSYFLQKDLGGKMNRWHREFEQAVGFSSLAVLSELIGYCIADTQHQFTYSCHDGVNDAVDHLAKESTRMVVSAFARDLVPGFAQRAASRCTGQKMFVTLDDLAGLWRHAPP